MDNLLLAKNENLLERSQERNTNFCLSQPLRLNILEEI
jgi:hypothetical protein